MSSEPDPRDSGLILLKGDAAVSRVNPDLDWWKHLLPLNAISFVLQLLPFVEIAFLPPSFPLKRTWGRGDSTQWINHSPLIYCGHCEAVVVTLPEMPVSLVFPS